MTRRTVFTAAFIAALVVAGGGVGVGVRFWALNERRAQLHRCVLTSQQAHPNEDARTRVTFLDAEVPECMAGAGYEKALHNDRCSLAVWQGDVYCYVPKGVVGKMMYEGQLFEREH